MIATGTASTAATNTSAVRRDTLVVFCGLLLVMFLGALDQTIMATATRTITTTRTSTPKRFRWKRRCWQRTT